MIEMLGSRIAQQRKKEGMSQAELAKRMNVSRSSVLAWERGDSYPSTDNLVRLSKLLHVSADYLLDCEQSHMICLDEYSNDEQTILLRLLQYFDQMAEKPDENKK